MRKLALLLLLVLVPFAASDAAAQSADLRMTFFQLSHDPATTGERFVASFRWRNEGPDPATFIRLSVNGTPVPYYVLSVATNGWPCYPSQDGTSFLCQNAVLAPGAQAELVLQMLTPPTAGTFTLRAELISATSDPNPSNNSEQRVMQLAAGPAADLSITPTTQTQHASASEVVTMQSLVTNHGPNAVSNVYAVFMAPVSASVPPFSASGAGWSCGHPPYGPQVLLCLRDRLEPGEVAPITLSITAPPTDGTYTIHSRVRAERHSDDALANGNALIAIEVGNEEEPEPQPEFERLLIPLTNDDLPGANDSLWRTETTVLLAMNEPFAWHPGACPGSTPCLRQEYPRNVPFRLERGFTGAAVNGEIVYLRPSDVPNVRLNSRVYDVARQVETAGAEIPIARESDFSSSTVSLLGIPVAPHYRHTLRVYDLDGRQDARVAVRLFANEETTPRVTVERTLTAQSAAMFDPYPANRPPFPGYLQLELGQLTSLAGVQNVRVDVEPLDPGLRLWSFVSVTNNETHHVTTFSQQ